MQIKTLIVPGLIALASSTAFGFSNGAPVMRTGAEVDGGLDCTACHRTFAPANSDPRGKLWITTLADYKPGVKQTVKVQIQHPEANRWGYQLTARLASNPARKAGTFTAVANVTRVQCAGGAPEGNCGDNLEFAEQTQPASFAGQGGGASWEIEWTPPAAGSGDVIFYFAGNAANNSNSNAGDYIYTRSAKIGEDGACNLTDTPRITGLQNGASFWPGPVSFNSIVAVFGTGFQRAGGTSNGGEYLNDQTFPKKAGCVAVEVNGTRAPIAYAQFNQINAQLPTNTPQTGSTQVRVIANPGQTNERRSDPFTIQVASAAPGFFRLLPTPCIAAIKVDTGEISGDPSLLDFAKPSKAGDVVSLFATGLGATDPIWQAGEIAEGPSRAAGTITLEFNGQPVDRANILYIGLVPGAISGLYQINMRIPNSNIRPNAHNELRIRIGTDILSPEGSTLYIAPN